MIDCQPGCHCQILDLLLSSQIATESGARDVQVLLQQLDRDGDGTISVEEFTQACDIDPGVMEALCVGMGAGGGGGVAVVGVMLMGVMYILCVAVGGGRWAVGSVVAPLTWLSCFALLIHLAGNTTQRSHLWHRK